VWTGVPPGGGETGKPVGSGEYADGSASVAPLGRPRASGVDGQKNGRRRLRREAPSPLSPALGAAA